MVTLTQKMEMSSTQLLRLLNGVREDFVSKYDAEIPEASDLNLLNAEQLLDILMDIEIKLYDKYNEAKYDIQETINEAYKEAVKRY
jgi:hypothetical protein